MKSRSGLLLGGQFQRDQQRQKGQPQATSWWSPVLALGEGTLALRAWVTPQHLDIRPFLPLLSFSPRHLCTQMPALPQA